MSQLLIENIRIVQASDKLMDGRILIEDGRIAAVSTESFPDYKGERFDGRGSVAMPGFIDVHIHGAKGADFMDSDSGAAEKIAAVLPAEGTTAFLATTLTHSSNRIIEAIENCRAFMNKTNGYGAEMLGLHLEGPFIHPDQAGAQPAAYIQEPSMEALRNWFGEDLADLKIVTLAPELDKGYRLIRELAEHDVIISAGHTTASYEIINQAQEAGLSHLTHYANAMRGLHHREIGVIGAGMLNQELYCELIADGVHLVPDMLKLVLQIIGSDRLLLITDSMRAKGLPDGSYQLGDQDVTVIGQKAILADGQLAGSVLKMNEGLRKLKEIADITWKEAIALSSGNAAKRLGIDNRKGSLETGKDADIVLVNEKFDVLQTFCKGTLSYDYLEE